MGQPTQRSKRILFGVVLIAAVALAFLFMKIGSGPSGPERLPETGHATSQAEPPSVSEPVPNASAPVPHPVPTEKVSISHLAAPIEPPSRDAVREEVAKNPHGTPHSMIEFSGRLAARMEQALENEEEAGKLFSELENCVRAADATTLPVRAVCLSNANRLGLRWPESLGENQRRLEGAANADVRKLVQATGVN